MDKSGHVRVVVVDDSFFMRKVICDILTTDPRIIIAGQAADGEEALRKISELRPDVVTLDLVMPKLSGLEVLRRLQHADYSPAIVMVSAQTHEAALVTLDCLEAGAIDFAPKPSESDAWQLQNTAADLHAKIAIALAAGARVGPGAEPRAPKAVVARPATAAYDAVVIGASTGGPVALEHIVPQLPVALGCPVVIAQHMPWAFVAALAQRLSTKCSMSVVVAQDGEPVRPGTIYFCPGGATTKIINLHGPAFRVEPSEAMLTPSVDALLSSAAEYYTDHLAAIILTGMGEDGLQGAKAIHQKGGTVIVQDEASSAVFGMGKAVEKAGLANVVLPLDDIVSWLAPKLPEAQPELA
jgi:two-component system, chemotaxis family, protein-glutamate methylesterase/glutaminase